MGRFEKFKSWVLKASLANFGDEIMRVGVWPS